MKTVNSLSGGKTSSYIAANYPADYNIFSLVRIEDTNCKFPDEKIRKVVEDRIQAPFIGTAEDDKIIYTMLDLEQYIGQPIDWVTGPTFESIIKKAGTLPNAFRRFCSSQMKFIPILNWCQENTELPVEMRIGYRVTEKNRASTMLEKLSEDGVEHQKMVVGIHPNSGRRKWKLLPYRVPSFPLINDGIGKDVIEEYWRDKPVRFAYMNNCVGCFHRNPMLLNHMYQRDEKKMDWFAKQEQKDRGIRWITSNGGGPYYEDIKNYKPQFDLFDDDFNQYCDSGFCGL